MTASKYTLVTVALALCTLVAPAGAALIQFNSVLDISACPTNPPGECSANPPMAPLTIRAGDTVDHAVTFANSLRLEMFDDDGGIERLSAWLLIPPPDASSFTISNITLDLLHLHGSLTAPLSAATEDGGGIHLGPLFFADFVATGSSISFDGYRARYTVDALSSDPSDYASIWFIAQADRISVQAVPEPGMLALLLAGVAGAVLAKRRRPTHPRTSPHQRGARSSPRPSGEGLGVTEKTPRQVRGLDSRHVRRGVFARA